MLWKHKSCNCLMTLRGHKRIWLGNSVHLKIGIVKLYLGFRFHDRLGSITWEENLSCFAIFCLGRGGVRILGSQQWSYCFIASMTHYLTTYTSLKWRNNKNNNNRDGIKRSFAREIVLFDSCTRRRNIINSQIKSKINWNKNVWRDRSYYISFL